MPATLALLMIAAAMNGARPSTIQPCEECIRAFTIKIYDYARVPAASLSAAREIVSRTYGTIGVRTEWIGLIRPREKTVHVRGEEARAAELGQVTLIILTPQMAARGHIAADVLGFAAVPEFGMGRIAYVIYDRVREAASDARSNEVDLLGFVMAHEIGHLLLPRGVQSAAGPMKGHLERRDLQQLDVRKMAFSAVEARQIRDLLDRTPR
jgi:hypothetical protein